MEKYTYDRQQFSPSSEGPPPAYELEAPVPPTSNLVGVNTDVHDDGRIEIDVTSRLAKSLAKLVPDAPVELADTSPPTKRPSKSWNIPLNIVIQVVGSRGDVQPFIALGQELQKFGHRVRLATHNVFDQFVRDAGLEFYPIGGDPKELMAYMVKNPGLIPSMKSLREGDIQRKRAMVAEMLDGCWKSCIEVDPLTQRPFVAEAIIANPPSFAHVHCAQVLGVPVHLMFTMPWSSTRAYPHPLANINYGSIDPEIANYISYGIVEWLTWQGLGDVINKWRRKLDLEDVPVTEGPRLAESLEIPFTYCWSPALVPKPLDWPEHIDVCGFFFREPPAYNPPPDIAQFLMSGPPPVYLGFGSIVLEDAQKMSTMLLEAVQACGVRAIISRGWSKLSSPVENKNVLFIDDCPHEWLFQHVSAVVHHGGAGTTACGLLNGRPTAIVPFFGDQPFWGKMVAAAGAGPSPIPHRSLTSQNLAEAISYCLTPEAASAAQGIAVRMRSESGVHAAVESFHANLPMERIQCDVLPGSPAAWIHKSKKIRLSKLAAQALIDNQIVSARDLAHFNTNPLTIANRRWDPVTGASSAALRTATNMADATVGIFSRPYEEYRRSQGTTEAGEGSSTGGTAALRMASASAKSIGRFNMSLFKGTMVDMPLAITEGFRAVPKLYGEEVQSHGDVTGWKSGATVAGKSFAHGMADGFSDLFVMPYKEAKANGGLGFAKGLGKGTLGFTSKTTSAMLGLVAYPGQGICQSIRKSVNSQTREKVKAAKQAEGEYLLRNCRNVDMEEAAIDNFRMLRSNK